MAKGIVSNISKAILSSEVNIHFTYHDQKLVGSHIINYHKNILKYFNFIM